MNITQEQLAARLGIQQGVISKIETHERRIDVIELRSICHAIGISFTDFISQLDTIIANQEIQSL
jgi:transcriptional regulator with XRE-family HTH domain